MVDFDQMRKRSLRAKQFLGVDWEGLSMLDITERGATQYSSHPSTEPICLGWQTKNFQGEAAEIWTPELGEFPPALVDAARSDEWTFVAHNAQFDRTFWLHLYWRGLLPCEPPKHWLCTAQRASINGLPRGLDDACSALGLPGKDPEGYKLMLRWCKPKKTRATKNRPASEILTPRTEIPIEDRQRIWSYCQADIDRMWRIMDRTKPVDAWQQLYYELDAVINARGFAIDNDMVETLTQRLNEAEELLVERAYAAAGFSINLNSTDQIKAFCLEQGVALAKVDAHHVREALKDPLMPDAAREILELRQLAALKASGKFQAFLDRGQQDPLSRSISVIRDWAIVDGANTGRHTAKGFQGQNMKREVCSEEEIRSLLDDTPEMTRLLYDEPLRLIGMAVRPMIMARREEHVLLIGDFGKIELCTLFWYAKEREPLKALKEGADLYRKLASVIYERPESAITPEQRQLGKTGVLGNGYGLGAAGFETQLTEKYGMPITPEIASKAVYGYREMFPGVPAFWRAVGDAMFKAVRGEPQRLGALKFVADANQLVIMLPSGRKLRYQKPYIDGRDVWYWGVDSKTHQFSRQKFWGGAATGHIVQATANDLQRCAAFDLTAQNFDIVLHAHDELVCEDVPERLEEFRATMAMEKARRDWMHGMLIIVDAKATKRYRK